MRRSLWLWFLALIVLIIVPGAVIARADVPETVPLSQTLAGQKVLRSGDQGAAVAALQRLLQARGYDPGPIDGIFGPLTEAAVRAAQAGLQLTRDGVAGARTVAALEQADSSAQPAEGGLAVTALASLPDDGPHAPSATLVLHQATAAPAPDLTTQPAADRKAEFALTFNGAPDPAQLPALLADLKQSDMKATFFITGQAARQRPDLVAAIAAAGHEIADGGQTDSDMTGLSPAAMTAQLTSSQQAIKAAAGKEPVFFRPPLGLANQALADAAAGLRLRSVLWTNVGVTDAPDTAAADLAAQLVDTVYPGSVLMLHQDRPNTVAAMASFLQTLAGKGIHSVTLSDLTASR